MLKPEFGKQKHDLTKNRKFVELFYILDLENISAYQQVNKITHKIGETTYMFHLSRMCRSEHDGMSDTIYNLDEIHDNILYYKNSQYASMYALDDQSNFTISPIIDGIDSLIVTIRVCRISVQAGSTNQADLCST